MLRVAVGAVVIRRLKVAESAPPVEGTLQLERSKRTSDHVRLFVFGPTLSVVLEPKLEVGLCSSTYVSTVDVEPVSVHVPFVSVCEPAHMCHEPTFSVAHQLKP